MKTFYTERDIEDMHAAGVTRVELNESVVLTDLARDKAADLGIALVQPDAPSPLSSSKKMATDLDEPQLVAQIKARVIARLGTDDYNGLLDQIIPKVLAQLNPPPASTNPAQTPREY